MNKQENLVELTSRKLITKFYSDKSQEQQEVLRYGLSALLSTLLGFLVIGAASNLLGVFKPAMTAALTSGVIRVFAGGVHSKTYKQCVLTGGVVFTSLGLAAGWLAPQFTQRVVMQLLWITFIIGAALIYLYAPAGVREKPINSEDKRRRLRIGAFAVFFLIAVAAMILLAFNINELLALALLLGSIWEVFTITPAAYKLFNREYIRG